MKKELYDLTNPQKSILLTEQFYQNTTVNNICGSVIVNEKLDFDIFKKSINYLVKTNDSFRIRFLQTDTDIKQYVDDYSFFDIETINIKSKEEIFDIEENISKKHFNIFEEKLFKFKIFKLEDNSGGFTLNIHHIISDGWSLGLVARKIMNTYEFLLNNSQENNTLEHSYIDFIENEKNYISSSKYQKDKLYWETAFSTVPNVVNLFPSKNNATSEFSCKGNRNSFTISKKDVEKISIFCSENKISIFNFFMAILSVYIYKFANTNHFVIGTPILNRTNFNEKNTIGMFISLAPLLVDIENNSSFKQLASKISVDSMGLLRHQKYPYSAILKHIRKQDQNFPALFNILLSYQLTKTNNDSNIDYSTRWAFNGTCADDLDIQLYDLNETGELNISYDYKISKYSEKEIFDLHNKLFNIITQVLNNQNIHINEIELLSNKEKEEIIYDFNKTETLYDKEKTIAELFEDQALKTPNNIAVVFENNSITYSEINKKANQIAHFLRTQKNIKPGDFVAIMLNRSIDLITGILGIVKSGATYVAIDPEYPKDRIEYMLEHCNSKLIFVNSNTKHILSNSSLEQIMISSEKLYNASSTENLEIVSNPNDLLYVIYTSGSTGTPKGVTIKNYNVNNFIIGMRKIIDFSKVKSMVSVATVCFDMFVFELWGSLLNGLKLVLANEQQQKFPPLLNALCVENDVDIFQTTPSRFKLLFDNETTECFKNVKHILIGGETVPETLFKKFLQYENLKIHHMYGPTETTVWSTAKTITSTADITIGKPIVNTEVYILDENKKVCPIGVAGEIYISGDGVGNGYLYNEELNNKSFIPNPFIPGKIMYKTGDLALYTENKEIIYLNRIDHQVKIRGFRIELDEIEKVIFNFPNIKNCVVMKKTLQNGHDILCAYYIENIPVDVTSLKRVLQQKLPTYMIPQYFIKLEDFPYTQNGKIDRKNLPLPNTQTEKTIFLKPRNIIDKKLIMILNDLFKIDNIQISDNLFELGMDSLIAINLSVRILKEFNVNLNIPDIFDNPTIKELSDFINKSEISNIKTTISKAETKDFYPLSSAQKRIYYASLVDGNNSILYNVSGGIIFDNMPDKEKLETCINKILDRHEAFKTYFTFENNTLVQKIATSVNFSLEYKKNETQEIENIFKDFIKPFDLQTAPLFRAKLVEFKNKQAIFMIDTHHIICDGASLNILIRDICSLYNSTSLPSLNITYKDFSSWELEQFNTKAFKNSENYWLEQFKDDIPVLNLPTTFPRPATKTYEGNLIVKHIESNLYNKIKNISKKYNVTPNIILLCAYYILLYKYTNQNDIIVGSPVIGRTLPELNDIIGMFVNTLPLREKINPNSSVLTFLNNIKENCAKAFTYQNYPFDTLVGKINAPRDNSRNFLFDVLFTYQTNNYSNINFEGLNAKHYRANDYTSKFDISLEVLPSNASYQLTFEYCTNLFDVEYINKFSENYINTVQYILENINSKISDVSILSDEERNKILYSFNNTTMQYNKNKTLANLFEEQVQKTPDNIAVVFEDKKLTYEELNKKANQIAWKLKNIGLVENSIIGIMLPRSLEILVCMLGALKAGVCYIPIDPSLPENRIEYMLENSKTNTLLTFDNIIEKFNKSKLNIKNIINVNLENSDIYSGKYKNLDLSINPESPSYIIYTSGSTGKPKGVMLKQKALTNLTNYLNKNVEFLKDEYSNISMASITTISFDIFIFETLICLQRGLKIIIANESEQNTPILLDNLIHKHNIKCIQMTPSRMALFMKNQETMPHLNNLQYITLAGEALPKELRDSLLNLGNTTIYNGYGPSETTVFSTFTDVTHHKEITIGKPLGNTQIYILDKNLNPLPVGEPGEVYIAGDGVAIKYVNNETITKERFIPNPFLENSIMYKTGDLAKYLPNGELSYIGRVDNQVKIRGLRIELDEIEKNILKFNNIEKCIISAKKDSNDRQFIIAYLIINNRISIHNLKEFLKEILPKYMIPTYFVILDEIPYLPNGKIDKNSLPEPNLKSQLSDQKYIAPKTKLEIQIVNIFQNLLSVNPIGLKDNFFELGGDSLLAINLQIELSKITNSITYSDIFLNPTVSDLVEKIKQNKKNANTDINSSEFLIYDKILQKNNILPKSLKINSFKNLLIAGTTGFLGAHILSEFLEKESGIAYCIIRSEAGMDIKEKFLNKLHYYFGRKYDSLIGNRIILINADISQNNLGLKNDDLKSIFNNIDGVINSAAIVSHFGEYELFKKVNVTGVENLLKLCKKYDKKFYHISTVSIAENNQNDHTLTDDITFYENNFYLDQKLNNVYIRTKFEAEKLVLDYINDGLDAYIFRVGNLMNRISDMKFQPNIEENAFVSRLVSFIKIKAIPSYLSDEYLEFSPVDACANAILNIMKTANQKNRVFHIFNPNHVSIKTFIKVLNNFKKFEIVEENEFLDIINNTLKKKNSDKVLSGIIKDFDTNKKITYRSNISVSNKFSVEYLEKTNFKWPEITDKYLEEFIKYILNLK